MRTTLRHIVTETTLSFNQCIDCDQKTTIYQPLRTMMENVSCLNKSCDRLNKYHLLTQRWVDRVIVNVSLKESHAILTHVLLMLLLILRLKMKWKCVSSTTKNITIV